MSENIEKNEKIDNLEIPKKLSLKEKISLMISNLKNSFKKKKKDNDLPVEKKKEKEEKESYDTLDSKNDKIQKGFLLRGLLIFAIMIAILLIYSAFKYMSLQSAYDRDLAAYNALIEEENKIELLDTDDSDVWRANSQQKIKELDEKIDENQDKILKAITESSKVTTENIATVETKLTDTISKTNVELNQKIDSLKIKTLETIDNKIMDFKKYVDGKNKDLSEDIENKIQPQLNVESISLPKPEDLKDSLLSLINDNDKEKKEEVKPVEEKKEEVKPVEEKKEEVKPVIIVKEYEDVELETIELASIPFITAEEKAKAEEEEKEEPKYKIISGITKGLTLNGGLIPTLGADGEDNVAPIMIRVDGNSIVSNKTNQDLEDCIVLASARGDLSSERVLIRTSKMTCTLEKENGNTDVFETPLKGWVIGEDGKYGLDGVLVSKSGVIIARTLMSGFIQGAADFMSASKNFYSPTEAANAVDTEAELIQPKNSTLAGYGLTNGASSAFEKLADYYMSLAEQTVPVIEILGGRSISIILNGGEEVEDIESKVLKITELQEF
jgi:conjugal transfer pilus assembly protein TraB